ncbi:MAG: hypothetical protein ABR902_04205 [Candidatus Korobacteraceae bacterium]|jgi:hypothetical protein
MTSLAATENTAAIPPSPLSQMDKQLVLLETLKSLLDEATRSLSGGEALPLLEVSRQINLTAQELSAFCLQVGCLPWTAEAQQRRRKLLSELSQQRAFCRAMLRRWRRSIVLRQQLLGLQDEPGPYTESLTLGWS